MKKFLFTLLPILLFALSVESSVDTTARVKGTVNVDDAVITAVHIPTNTTKTVTAIGGNFNINFLPIGGPYKITISKVGFETEIINIATLNSTEPLKLTANLVGADVEEVVVVGSRISGTEVRSGSVLTSQDIQDMPTIGRNIQDYVKFDPRVTINNAYSRQTEVSVMGKNGRLNDFTIDGISFNDAFGLNDSGFATMKNPIDVDFVDEIAVEITPYDVSKAGASGGTISAVTKSGTNKFSGSIYYTERDEGDIGDLPNGEEYSDFEENALAITFSGPIIKDKLFFFIGYSESEDVRPDLWGAADSGSVNTYNTTNAELNEIAAFTLDTYGYDVGYFNNVSYPTTQEQSIIKLTGSINDNHSFDIVNQITEDSYYSRYNSSRNPIPSNNWYEIPPESDRTTINLYSTWSDRLSTRIRFSDRYFEQDANNPDGGYGGLFPEFHIYDNDEIIYIGGDRYRGHNLIKVDQELMSIKVNYALDSHYLTFGYETDSSSIYNSFINRYTGEVNFGSIEDYYAGNFNRVEVFRVATDHGGPYSLTRDDPALPAARFDIDETVFYIQDEFQVSDIFTLTFGVRYYDFDIPQQALLNESYQSRFGFRNNAQVSYTLTQPRFSFDMDVSDVWFGGNDKIVSAQFTGGYGLFQGRLPKVFFGNGFGRSSADSFYSRLRSCAGPIPNLNSGAVTGVTDPRFWWARSDASTCGVLDSSSAFFGFTHGTDPDFEGISVYRGNLRLAMQTANGYDFSVEYNLDRTNKDVSFKDYSYEVEGYLADGRPITDSNENTYITNSGDGGGKAFTFTLSKDFDNGIEMYAGYTRMEQEDVSAMTSAQHSSSYGYQPRGYGELYPAARSSFMAENKLVLALSYSSQFFEFGDTRFSLFALRKSGEPYSITLDGNSFNGQGEYGYDLAYIPTGTDDPNVVFSSSDVANDVMAFVNSDGCISKYRGVIIPRNTCDSPYQGRIDLRITQDINLFDDYKLIAYFDIQNLANLLDDEKGWAQEVSRNVSRAIIIDGADDLGRYNITGVDPDDGYFYSTNNGQSMWQMNLGVTLRF